MRILGAHKVEDCFDGSSVFDYELSEAWTEPFIRALASIGTLDYFPEFPRPFFRLRTKRGLFLKGLAGTRRCRVILPRKNQQQAKRQLEETLAGMCVDGGVTSWASTLEE